MKYLIAVQFDESAPEPPEEEMRAQMDRTSKVTEEMRAAGSWVFVGACCPRTRPPWCVRATGRPR